MQLALGQGFDAGSIGCARPCASVDLMAEASKLALCRGTVSGRGSGVKLGRDANGLAGEEQAAVAGGSITS